MSTPLIPPFSWTPAILPVKSNGRWHGNVPARSLIPAIDGATYYVDPAFGSDANPGTSASPLRTIYAALGKSNVGEVFVAPATNASKDDGGWLAPTIVTSASHVVIRPWNIRQGRPLVTNAWSHQEGNWSQSGNVYIASRNGVSAVVDIAGGLDDLVVLEKAPDSASCANRPGTWFQNVGGTSLSVNTLGAAEPSPTLKVLVGTCAVWNSNKGLTVEGIDFLGGLSVPDGAGDVRIIDCAAYCAVGNGFSINTSGLTVMENCRSDFNTLDGFNYHESPSNGPGKVIEIGCRSSLTGTATLSNQSSTSHDGTMILRIGCEYTGGGNHCIADVNPGTQAWNVGLRLGSSQDGAVGMYLADAEAWLHDCDLGTSSVSLSISGTGIAHLSETEPLVITGTTDTYTQG